MTAELSPAVFTLFRALVGERLGITFAPGDRELFAQKMAVRQEESGFASPLDYYYFLRYDDPHGIEFDALTDALVVGETYFFRELEPLRAGMRHVILPAIEARGRARVWSAACATGEEPVSLAILLEMEGCLSNVEIVASDVSAKAIARAARGSHSRRALRAPLVGTERWLSQVDGRAASASHLRACIQWKRVNLLDGAACGALGTFDLVLCRNVLIYFDDATVRRVVDHLTRALAPDGRLLVGVSESLLRFGTMLTCEERGNAFFYKRQKA